MTGTGVLVGVGVLVGTGVSVLVGVGVLVGTGVGVLVGMGVLVGTGVGVLVGAGASVSAGVSVLVGRGVGAGVFVSRGVGAMSTGDGVGHATLRARLSFPRSSGVGVAVTTTTTCPGWMQALISIAANVAATIPTVFINSRNPRLSLLGEQLSSSQSTCPLVLAQDSFEKLLNPLLMLIDSLLILISICGL